MDFLRKYKEQEDERLAKIMFRPTQGRNKGMLIFILIMLSIGSTGAALYFWNEAGRQSAYVVDVVAETPAPDLSSKMIIEEVGKLMVLPQGEEPTIATITEPDKLKDKPFFAKAKVGDKVLIYAKAKKAILYDPDEKRILEMAPLNIEVN